MKKFILIAETVAFSMIASFMVMAGTWKHDSTGWWYDNGDGTYPASTWQWIDGNNDGVAECYYFNQYGYMASNTFQDGYQLNTDGQWVTNGIIQTKNVWNTSNSKNHQKKQTQSYSDKTSNSETSKESVLNLMNAHPYSKFSNLRTSNNELWRECYTLERNAYKAFTLDGDYTELSFKYAPSSEFSKDRGYTVSVLGDDDSILWESDEINFYSPTKSTTVDVSGQKEIRLFVTGDSYVGGYILFKDMYAE